MPFPRFKHEVWIEDGTVRMANDDDPYYLQEFKTPEEVDSFIKELTDAKNKCWSGKIK